jgi:protein gp37
MQGNETVEQYEILSQGGQAMNKTKIPWATHVWNPVTGCTPVSDGCQNCYAERIANRFNGRRYLGIDVNGGVLEEFNPDYFKVTLHPEKLNEPLRRRKPAKIFVCSMSDLFHPDVPINFIAEVFDRMACATLTCHHKGYDYYSECWGGDPHTFMILTKRPERMKKIVEKELLDFADNYLPGDCALNQARDSIKEWPLPNVWLGVTAENQARADERIPILLQTPAAKRFISIEPMLGPISFRWPRWDKSEPHPKRIKQLPSVERNGRMLAGCVYEYDGLRMLDWVICGGETGTGARECREEWVRAVYDQCQAAGVPFFFKGTGKNWEPIAPCCGPEQKEWEEGRIKNIWMRRREWPR